MVYVLKHFSISNGLVHCFVMILVVDYDSLVRFYFFDIATCTLMRFQLMCKLVVIVY